MNNAAVLLPSAFPEMFAETSVIPVPVIVEEIDKIIDLAVETKMSAHVFRERIMYYSNKYEKIPMIVKKCTDLIDYYTSEYSDI